MLAVVGDRVILRTIAKLGRNWVIGDEGRPDPKISTVYATHGPRKASRAGFDGQGGGIAWIPGGKAPKRQADRHTTMEQDTEQPLKMIEIGGYKGYEMSTKGGRRMISPGYEKADKRCGRPTCRSSCPGKNPLL